MGITNLLQFVKDAGCIVQMSDLKNSTVAVDAYCWLHKGIFSCADKLARGEDSDMYVKYCMKYVNMLLGWKIKVIMVFDGRHLPAKEATEKERKKKRDNHKMRAAELLILERGNEAQSHLRQSIDVTHKMALEVIKACREKHVDCIVAPFEADAQMAYLNIAGYADYVITEDSDLLVFGAKKVIYKLDLTGNCCFIDRSKLPQALKVRDQQYSDAKFRYMCILSGSDYWPGIKGMGLKKAKDYVFSIEDPNFENALRKMRTYVKGSSEVTPEVLRSFRSTNLMFMFQPVYDPIKRQVVPLNNLDPTKADKVFSFLSLNNLKLPNEQAFQLALGNLDPFSLKEMDQWNPENLENLNELPNTSIWSKQYKISSYQSMPSIEKSPAKDSTNIFRQMMPVNQKQSDRSTLTKNESPEKHLSILRPFNNPQRKGSSPHEKSPESVHNEIPTMPFKRKLEELDESDSLQKLYSPTPMVCSDSSKKSPTNKPSRSTYFSENSSSPRVQNPFVKSKSPRSLNPFLKSLEAGGSPDLSDRSLKSGLSQILNQGSRKKVIQNILSPYFQKENPS